MTKRKMTLTERKIAEMLTENTGRHFLDSGGAYGRNWEVNQHRDFLSEDPIDLNARYGDISFTLNLFHFLTEKLEYDPNMQRKLTAFAKREDQKENHWLGTMTDFVEMLKEKDDSVSGIYGDGEPLVVNSYNEENNLSQTIQFIYWEDKDGDHVLLQVHGGCDVRGGYTAPKAFTCNDELSIFDYHRGSIYCTGDNKNTVQTEIKGMEKEDCEAYWDTDDGYHWYFQGSCGYGAGVQLEKYDTVKQEDEDEDDPEDDKGWKPGTLYICDDNSILCPYCGSKLAGSLY